MTTRRGPGALMYALRGAVSTPSKHETQTATNEVCLEMTVPSDVGGQASASILLAHTPRDFAESRPDEIVH